MTAEMTQDTAGGASGAPAMSFKDKRLAGVDTPADWRRELAARIRAVRGVSHANDPARGYRADAQRCRKGQASYHRLFGIPRVLKNFAGFVQTSPGPVVQKTAPPAKVLDAAEQRAFLATAGGVFVADHLGNTLDAHDAAALARYVEGSATDFAGWITVQASARMVAMGIRTKTRAHAVEQLRQIFQAQRRCREADGAPAPARR